MNRIKKIEILDRLVTLPQYLLPQHLLSDVVDKVARLRWVPGKDFLIKAFIRHYRVEMGDALHSDPKFYADFNSFFTRGLHEKARPIAKAPDSVVSPVDAKISAIGALSDQTLLSAKGHQYRLETLLGGDSRRAERFVGGSSATLYLSPRDYHRIHMPVAGRLREMIHIPGRLFAVNDSAVNVVPGLFARNERVVTIFDTVVGPMALILVGALFVGSIETVWAGEVTPPTRESPKVWTYPEIGTDSITLGKGIEMGRFNMGSTVILLFGPGAVSWDASVVPGKTMRMGERLADCRVFSP